MLFSLNNKHNFKRTARIQTSNILLLKQIYLQFACYHFFAQDTKFPKASVDYSAYAVPRSSEVEVNVIITLKVPHSLEVVERPHVAISLVIDKSSSMNSVGKLDYAKKGGIALIEKLEPRDKLAIIAFDGKVQTLQDIEPVTDKDKFTKIVDSIQIGIQTDISLGLEQGIIHIEGTTIQGTKRVIVLSDGVTLNSEKVVPMATKAHGRGISISSIGLGKHYNEDLMQQLALNGGGKYYYVLDAKQLPGVFDTELQLTKDTITRSTRAAIVTWPCVQQVKVSGIPFREGKDEIVLDISDLQIDKKRQIIIKLTENTKETRGNQLDLCRIYIQFILLGDSRLQRIDIPLYVQVEDKQSIINIVNADVQPVLLPVGKIGSKSCSHSQSIERTATFLLNTETNEVIIKSYEEMKEEHEDEARKLLSDHKMRQYAFQAVLIKQNKLMSPSAAIASFLSQKQSETAIEQNNTINQSIMMTSLIFQPHFLSFDYEFKIQLKNKLNKQKRMHMMKSMKDTKKKKMNHFQLFKVLYQLSLEWSSLVISEKEQSIMEDVAQHLLSAIGEKGGILSFVSEYSSAIKFKVINMKVSGEGSDLLIQSLTGFLMSGITCNIEQIIFGYVHVHINSEDKFIEVQFSREESVLDFKKKIEEKISIPVKKQRLYFGKIEIFNDLT